MARLFWQRCARCGRLTLSRVGAPVSCECAHTGAGASAHAQGSTPALPASAPIPLAPPPSAPVLALLTPEQDAAARRLLASVFPHGFDF